MERSTTLRYHRSVFVLAFALSGAELLRLGWCRRALVSWMRPRVTKDCRIFSHAAGITTQLLCRIEVLKKCASMNVANVRSSSELFGVRVGSAGGPRCIAASGDETRGKHALRVWLRLFLSRRTSWFPLERTENDPCRLLL